MARHFPSSAKGITPQGRANFQVGETLMRSMSARVTESVLTAIFAQVLSAAPADQAEAGGIEQQLRAQYVLAQASHFNRVSSAGTVIVIQQSGLSAAPPASLTGATGWYRNVFKDGKRQNHGLPEMAWQNTGTLRAIQTGDRFYISKIDVKDNGIHFYLVSCEQTDGNYYYAGVSFQFSKGYQTSLSFVAGNDGLEYIGIAYALGAAQRAFALEAIHRGLNFLHFIG